MEENRYSRGKIYKIVDNTNGNIYVGSTTEPTLARRLVKHRSNYKSYLDGKYHFITSFKILENDNYDIVLLENCQCDTKDELHKRERYYIETLECVNKSIVGRTSLQYYFDNAEKYKIKRKKYYEDNKDKFKEYDKIYREKNKDYLKKYREDNKENINKYKEENKEKLKQQQKEKKFCIYCNIEIRKYAFKRHVNTIKHQNNLNNIN
jgi:hypothetical protein